MELKFQRAGQQYVLTFAANSFYLWSANVNGTASKGRTIMNELIMVWKDAVIA
jgi:hypothetical protein